MGNIYCVQGKKCIKSLSPNEPEYDLSISTYNEYKNPFYPNGFRNEKFQREEMLRIEQEERIRREEEERIRREEEERIRIEEEERIRIEEEERIKKEKEERLKKEEEERLKKEEEEKKKLNDLKEAILKKEAENRKGINMNIINNSSENNINNISIEDSIKIENDTSRM